jgi:ABC-type phosphate/phosphonate transport system substrate-binding protein
MVTGAAGQLRLSRSTLLVGAVAGSPAVVTIWQGMRDFFRGAPVEIDYELYSTYARMTQALIAGHIDVAWNTNLAWVQTVRLTDGKCRALAMRDTDLASRTFFSAAAALASAGRRMCGGSGWPSGGPTLPRPRFSHSIICSRAA